MRAFLAINLDRKMKELVAGVQDELKKRTRGFRWVNPELLHLTLKFLGEIRSEDLQLFEQPLKELAEKMPPFRLTFDRLGAFPNFRRPRVIWIGAQVGSEQLELLAEKIESVFRSLSFQPDQRKRGKEENIFVPHLTIGRKRKDQDIYFPSEILHEDWNCEYAVSVDRFSLMQSILYASGPVYRPVKEFLLDA